jgi:hypothetical protein
MPAAVPADSPPRDPQLPSPAVRTAVSLALFVHLFAVGVAVLSNTEASALQVGLRPVVEPYLQLLNLDRSYRFHLTWYDQDEVDETPAGELPSSYIDVDFAVTGYVAVTTRDRDQSAVSDRREFTFPDPELWPHERWLRDEALAANLCRSRMGAAERGEEGAARLADPLGRRMLAQYGPVDKDLRGELICRGRRLQRMPDARSDDPQVRNPLSDRYWTAPIHEADVKRVAGIYLYTTRAPRGEATPAAGTPPAQQP